METDTGAHFISLYTRAYNSLFRLGVYFYFFHPCVIFQKFWIKKPLLGIVLQSFPGLSRSYFSIKDKIVLRASKPDKHPSLPQNVAYVSVLSYSVFRLNKQQFIELIYHVQSTVLNSWYSLFI